MRLIDCCSALLLLLLIPRVCEAGKILVVPNDGSHWVNMDILLQALHLRGHNITILRTSKSWYIPYNSSDYNTVTVQTEKSLDQKFFQSVLSVANEYERGTISSQNLMRKIIEYQEVGAEFMSKTLDDQEMVRNIKESKFDLLLTDPAWGGGVILAEYFNLPLVLNVHWLLVREAHFAFAPSPLSYVPTPQSGNMDKMTFLERVQNVGIFITVEIYYHVLVKQTYQKVCDKYLGPDFEYQQLVLNADIWLMRTDFVFEYPHPTMPNVVYVGGFQCKPAKPLPEHLEEFVKSSGDHGVIIMSLGALIGEIPPDLANEIAAAFAKLPQKVIWRYPGERPATLGNNTLLVDWMPQNDLLGHPKIKLFVTHGGMNGIYEAIYHGVPIVGIPIVFDQVENLSRMRAKGTAKVMDRFKLDRETFQSAIQEVLNEPSYRMNMQQLSRLHRDQPMTPLDKALFWIEFVMRHKGAAHLRTESYRLPWYSYHSVDVVLFLAGAVLLVLFFIFILMRTSKIINDHLHPSHHWLSLLNILIKCLTLVNHIWDFRSQKSKYQHHIEEHEENYQI